MSSPHTAQTPQRTPPRAGSQLGILAALASPSPKAERLPARLGPSPAPLASPMLGTGAHSPAQDSASPPHSPSTQAAMRKNRRESAGMGEVAVSAGGGAQVARGSSSGSSRWSPGRPSAIPATQLDVLALVTATSPPMPSRHRWVGRSTSKPAFAQAPRTPVAAARGAANGKRKGGSGSDTVSEDESTLRSYSSVRRTRHQSVRMRPLPRAAAPGPHLGVLARASRVLQPAIGGETRADGSGSGGETTETDEEMSRTQTPVHRRAAVAHRAHDRAAALRRPAHAQPGSYELAEGGWARVLPASEPAVHRRSRRRLLNGARGTVLSKQLSQLAEEGPRAGTVGRPGVAQEDRAHDSSISLSPSASPSPSRARLGQWQAGARAQTMASGSETETDTELASRIPGSETETETENTTGSSETHPSSAHARPVRLSAVSASRVRPHYQQPPAPPGNVAGGHQQPRVRRGELLATQDGAGAEAGSGGETTETDDEFFGPPAALHASIRPPQRVVRQLAGLRARQLQPTVLDLNGSRPAARPAHSEDHAAPFAQAAEHQPRTAPAAGLDGGGGLGLGISAGSSRQRNGSVRIASTPSRVASGAVAGAISRVLAAPPCGPGIPLDPGAADPPPSGLGRAPPMPGGDDVTFHGAALRRLERSHGRGPPPGSGETVIANRKRALTAPSSLDPPLGRRGAYGPGGRVLTTAESLLEGAGETASGYNTPPEQGRHMSPRGGFLGESPMSSLRSSLLARTNAPAQTLRALPQQHPTPSTPADAERTTLAAAVDSDQADDEPGATPSRPASPSMDAVLRQNRKRLRTPSLAAPPPPHTGGSSSPSSRRRHDEPPPAADVVFPPIDRSDS
ncbi:hypothetical protein H4R19_004174 [Coemansia spiralis]|nr:hypothetical protein H4R19_004174 [Coemansia spiralis]